MVLIPMCLHSIAPTEDASESQRWKHLLVQYGHIYIYTYVCIQYVVYVDRCACSHVMLEIRV